MEFKDCLIIYLPALVIALFVGVCFWLFPNNHDPPPPSYTEIKKREFTNTTGLNLWLAAHPERDVVSVEDGKVWLKKRVNE